MKITALAALLLGTVMLGACSPALFPGLHYAVDDNADEFWRGVWTKTGLCIEWADGSTANCES